MILNDELKFFQDLNLDILKRRVVFKKFEDEMKKTSIADDNDFLTISWYGYIVSQLSDCRKFFDRDDNAHSFQFVVRHINDSILRGKHRILFDKWKNDKLETVLNKYLLHVDTRFSEIKTEISVQTLNSFIDELENYLKEIFNDLSEKHSDVSMLDYECFLKDREQEVEEFFEAVGVMYNSVPKFTS